jgi:hypothetical protein
VEPLDVIEQSLAELAIVAMAGDGVMEDFIIAAAGDSVTGLG